VFINLPKKRKWRGQARAGGRDGLGRGWRVLINNANGYTMVEGAGNRDMAKNCPKKAKMVG
jgi:hypothetical protein